MLIASGTITVVAEENGTTGRGGTLTTAALRLRYPEVFCLPNWQARVVVAVEGA